MGFFIIAHRGNILGPNPQRENEPSYILEAVQKGFYVEIDVRLINGELWLGHDEPQYKVNPEFLKHDNLFCHAKNAESLKYLLDQGIRTFWHQEDDYTITSDGYIWAYPGKELNSRSIAVLPEKFPEVYWQKSAGVCTDYAYRYKVDYAYLSLIKEFAK